MKHTARVLAPLLMLCLTAQHAAAEVCALVDASNTFERFHVVTRPDEGIIWSKLTSSIPDHWCLNLQGDHDHPLRARGDVPDGVPEFGGVWVPDLLWGGGTEDRVAKPAAPRRARSASSESPPSGGRLVPIVVWTRHDGNDWELMYAFWDHRIGLWSEPALVDSVPNDHDDIEPALYVDSDQLILVWQRVGRGVMETSGRLWLNAGFFDVMWEQPSRLRHWDRAGAD